MPRNSLWTNSDGLIVGFGTHSIDGSGATKSSVKGDVQTVKLKITGTGLLDAAVPNALENANAVVIPSGAYIKSAFLAVTTAFTSGGSAVLDIGTIGLDDVIVDDDGIHSAVAVATLVANYDVACSGALIGTKLTSAQKVYASYDTAAFTAGEAVLIVEYIPA
jgi:hypothetical protein